VKPITEIRLPFISGNVHKGIQEEVISHIRTLHSIVAKSPFSF
jgi:hypothetical protein